MGLTFTRDARKPARKASPAPVVSSGVTFKDRYVTTVIGLPARSLEGVGATRSSSSHQNSNHCLKLLQHLAMHAAILTAKQYAYTAHSPT